MDSSSFSSSSEIDESAVDAVIAEAADLCALEQIAALNTAHLVDCPLPTNLESRFEKLKSFPSSAAVGPRPKTPAQFPDEEKENKPASPNRSESGPVQTPKPTELPPEKIAGQRAAGDQSPPRVTFCCFGCSLKRMQRRGGVGEEEEMLKEFGGSAAELRKQRRRLKKAWREQEKASQEAEKMARWVEEVSVSVNEAAAVDDLLKREFKL